MSDTSCIVAALSSWHEQHGRASQEIERRVSDGETHVFAGPVVVESYSVMTRLPQPNRLSPREASRLLLANLSLPGVRIVAMEASAFPELVRRAPVEGVTGGGIHDRVILECALRAGAHALLTFNERHFRSLAQGRIAVIVPGANAPGVEGDG